MHARMMPLIGFLMKPTLFPSEKSWTSHSLLYFMYVYEFLSSTTDAACISMFLVCVHVRTTLHQLHHTARFCSSKARGIEVTYEEKVKREETS